MRWDLVNSPKALEQSVSIGVKALSDEQDAHFSPREIADINVEP